MGKRGCILLENEKPKGGGMEKLASFIVDKRNLFFLLYIFALIFSAIATGWVKVEDDITTYLPDTTETRQGLTVMNDNFVTYGTANVMVSNITYDTALDIQSRLEDIEGVTTVEFDDTDEHYTNASALFSVSFDAEVGDERAENALQEIRDELEGSYDTSIYSEVGYDSSADLQSEMLVIVIIAAIIIVVVLTLTSRSYAEVPVLLMTFGAAALLNMGTNFLCGTISFISNSVTVILQLALAIDYAIILCHRFSDEHETLPTREACIAALSKAIPEISSSSLTTISGLAALAFMHFGIGRDLATVLIKAILFSMLCVFTLMPGLLVLFSKLIDKTRHKNQIAYQKIKNTFGSSNMVAVIVPSGDYESEGRILDELDACAEVKSTMGLANIEAMDGYMLTDAVTPRQLAEMADLDYEVAKALYGAYDVDRFLEQEMHDGNITLSGDVQDTLDDLFDQLDEAQKQLQSDDYSRMVVYLNLPEETDETFAFVNKMHDIIGKYYATDSFYVVGNTTSAMDLSSSFGEDNLLISVLSALFVILVLLFTFKSAGLPVLLIIVIQGSIWINFSVPYLQHTPLYFLGYLIVNSIQMGANIDYAIVISSHYTDLKKVMRPREAIVAALNESFPTIFTSGSILASAGILISVLTTNPVIAAIGTCLGRGTIVSIMLVLFVLPQILILGDTIIERTSFEMKGVAGMARTASGTMHVNGRVRGYINGVVDAEIKGVLHGQFSANIATGTEFTVDKPDMYLSEKNIHESEDGAPEPGTPDTPDTDTKGGDAE